MADLVCIKTYEAKLDAVADRDILQEYGVTALVVTDSGKLDLPQIEDGDHLGVKLMVPELDAPQAISILENLQRSIA